MAQMTMYEGINNSPITALDGDLSASATTIPVVAASAFPAPPSLCTIGTEDNAELVLYTGISGSRLTGCTRGYNGTTARAWPDETSVYRAFSEYDQKAIQGNIRNHEDRIRTIEGSTAPNILVPLSAPIAEFSDGADGLPLTALTVGIEATQAGSGDPSLENIRAISGWTGAKIRRTARNLWGGDAVLADVKDAIPSATVDAEARTVSFLASATASFVILGEGSANKPHRFRFKENTRYTFIVTFQNPSGTAANLRVVYTDGTSTVIPALGAAGEKETKVLVTAAGKTVKHLGKQYAQASTVLYADECGLFEGVVTAEEFEAYRGSEVAVDWEAAAGEVYGGTLNVLTGELSVTHKKITVTEVDTVTSVYGILRIGAFGTIISNGSGTICNMLVRYDGAASTLPSGKFMTLNSPGYNRAQANIRLPGIELTKAAYNEKLAELAEAGTPLEIVCALAEPEIYQLTPAQLSTLLGENRIWADAGDVEVTYTADTKTYIDNRLAELTALVLEKE